MKSFIAEAFACVLVATVKVRRSGCKANNVFSRFETEIGGKREVCRLEKTGQSLPCANFIENRPIARGVWHGATPASAIAA